MVKSQLEENRCVNQALLAEFEEQVPVTGRFLERPPEDRLQWRPHDKERKKIRQSRDWCYQEES